MNYLISSLIGYLLGSIPTAYLLLKKSKGLDIRNEGSGNVGAFNSYDITKSKLMGLSVLFIDLLKGLLSVLIIKFIFPESFLFPAFSIFFAVLSHCYNPWINFEGGRGLATAAGGAILLFPFLLVVWAILWVIFYVMRKDILFANIAATIMSVLVVFNSETIAVKYAFPKPDNTGILVFFSASILTIIFIKHINPLKELIQNKLKNKND